MTESKKTKRSLAGIVAAVFAASCSACSTQTSPSDTPFPISPRTAYEEALQNQPPTQPAKKSSASPVDAVQLPTIHCLVSATRSNQDVTTGIKPGVIIRLENDANQTDAFLVYRVPASSRTPGSFILVDDMVFGDEGTHGSGTYVFELQTTNGQNCFVTVAITSEDTAEKHLIKVKASFPE
ncbi:hypothetical protein EBR21_02465 [bacterium]|nr:hypothetical protein [bacterium]